MPSPATCITTGSLSAFEGIKISDRSRAPCSADDEVVFLYSVPCRPHNPSISSPQPIMTDADRGLCSAKENVLLRDQVKKKKTTFKRPRAIPRSTIPAAIRNKSVWLGHEMDSGAPVYGCFSNVGRFRYKADIEQPGRATDPGPSMSVVTTSHEKVTYRASFRDMSYRQVRAEVRRRLIAITTQDYSHGEI